MDVLVIGASGHGRVVIDLLEREGRHTIVGLADSIHEVGSSFCGYAVLGRDTEIATLQERYGFKGVLVAIGDNWARSEVVARVRHELPGVCFPAVVHPSCIIGNDVAIQDGSVVLAGSIVNAGARIGKHCIINTRASIDHDCELGNFASVAPGATLGGRVRVGMFTAISLGSSIIHRITIGEHTVIGAGAVVVTDIPERCVAYGVPARVARGRSKGEPYV